MRTDLPQPQGLPIGEISSKLPRGILGSKSQDDIGTAPSQRYCRWVRQPTDIELYQVSKESFAFPMSIPVGEWMGMVGEG